MELKFQGDKMDRRKRANRNRIIRNNKKTKMITTIVAMILLLILIIFGANSEVLNKISPKNAF